MLYKLSILEAFTVLHKLSILEAFTVLCKLRITCCSNECMLCCSCCNCDVTISRLPATSWGTTPTDVLLGIPVLVECRWGGWSLWEGHGGGEQQSLRDVNIDKDIAPSSLRLDTGVIICFSLSDSAITLDACLTHSCASFRHRRSFFSNAIHSLVSQSRSPRDYTLRQVHTSAQLSSAQRYSVFPPFARDN